MLLFIVYFGITLVVGFDLGFNWSGISLVLGSVAALWGGSGGKGLWHSRPMLRFKVLGVLWALGLGYVGVLMVQDSQVKLNLFGTGVTGDIWVIGGVVLFFFTTGMSEYRRRMLAERDS